MKTISFLLAYFCAISLSAQKIDTLCLKNQTGEFGYGELHLTKAQYRILNRLERWFPLSCNYGYLDIDSGYMYTPRTISKDSALKIVFYAPSFMKLLPEGFNLLEARAGGYWIKKKNGDIRIKWLDPNTLEERAKNKKVRIITIKTPEQKSLVEMSFFIRRYFQLRKIIPPDHWGLFLWCK